MQDQGRTISRLAREADVNVETIRYYERRGLLRRPRKPLSGWRRYDDTALRTLRFVRRAQRLGFSLDEIETLLGLRHSTSARACARVSAKARAKVSEIDTKVRDLLAMREVLAGLAASCPEDAPGCACPVLDALFQDE